MRPHTSTPECVKPIMFMVIKWGIAFYKEAHVLYLLLIAYEAYWPVPVKVERVTMKGRLSKSLDEEALDC